MPNMDEVVKELKENLAQLTPDRKVVPNERFFVFLGLLIEERERSLIYENELIEIIRKDRERIAEQDKQLKNFKEAWDEQVEELRSLRALYTSANAKENEELYYWQPYHENHLETLTGGVVIRAEWMRQLIQMARAEQDKEIKRYKAALEMIGFESDYATKDELISWARSEIK